MNTRKRTLLIVALPLLASLLTSCTTKQEISPIPTPINTATPLPLLTPPPTATLEPVPTAGPPSAEIPTSEPVAAPPTPTTCGPPAGWVVYTVRANDTLYALARKTNTTVKQIQRANCLEGSLIFAGQPLYLPFVPSPPPATRPPVPAPTRTVEQVPAPTPGLTSTPTPTVEQPDAPPPTPKPRGTTESLPAPGPGNPTLAIVPAAGPPGTRFTIRITEFAPHESVTVRIVSAATLQIVYQVSFVLDSKGNGRAIYASPSDAVVGGYTAQALGTSSSASGDFTITSSP